MQKVTSELYAPWLVHGAVFDLATRTKLRLTGADRVRYLNGQVTANVKSLVPGQTVAACVTTAKGKLSAEIVITATDEALWIDADESVRGTLPARLERYIVADDVMVEDATGDQALLHFLGPESAGAAFAARVAPAAVVRANRLGTPGWDVRLAATAASDLLTLLVREGFLMGGEALSELIRIEAGVPRWGRELTEETLPPEAGLDRTHLDYAKGCYIGQEVISRLRSVGHVNRQLTGFVSSTGAPLEPGWSLFTGPTGTVTEAETGAADTVAARPVGLLTSAAYSFALAKPIALGYLRRGTPPGALLARPPGGTAPPAEVTPAALPLVAHHFPSP